MKEALGKKGDIARSLNEQLKYSEKINYSTNKKLNDLRIKKEEQRDQNMSTISDQDRKITCAEQDIQNMSMKSQEHLKI